MDPNAQQPTQTPGATKPDAAPISVKKIAAGAKVHLVHARRGHVEAEVTKANKDGTVDLETIEPDPFTKNPVTGAPAPLVITSSPLDPAGMKHDSWHPIE